MEAGRICAGRDGYGSALANQALDQSFDLTTAFCPTGRRANYLEKRGSALKRRAGVKQELDYPLTSLALPMLKRALA